MIVISDKDPFTCAEFIVATYLEVANAVAKLAVETGVQHLDPTFNNVGCFLKHFI